VRPYGQGPGSPYKAIVDGLWPQLGDEDPRQHRWDVAYREATTVTVAHRPSPDMPLTFTRPGDPDPLRGPEVQPLVKVTCVAARHNRSRPPTLAEVWQTSVGLLFVAKLPGRLLDPGEVPGDPLDPPAAVRNWNKPAQPSHVPDVAAHGWSHVPITIVRLLLTDDVDAKLWVTCVDHGPADLDRAKLSREYDAYLKASRRSDTPGPCYLRLDSVAALYSD
jgi:hypothetical protein